MNIDKAYLLGLIIGGGKVGKGFTNLVIDLPYRNWGNIVDQPARAGQIARDILTRVNPIFQNEYGLTVYFNAEPEWRMVCDGNLESLVSDFRRFGINIIGELRKKVSISGIIPFLIDDNLKREFVAGLADSIGSLATSHRRFNEDFQIISFEFSGNNYLLVYETCRLLAEINCYPDQILWNHPNQHSTENPYYRQWKKGFKLRVLLDQYTAQGSFAFLAKQESAMQNRNLQQTTTLHQAVPCEEKEINIQPRTVHNAENDYWLPEYIRGYHFIHHKHICAIMGCPKAPVDKLMPYLKRIEYFINPYPIILRESTHYVEDIIRNEPTMANREYRQMTFDIRELLRTYNNNPNCLIWGNAQLDSGYPVSQVLHAIAYVSAGIRNNLFGTRVKDGIINEINTGIERGIINNIRIHMPNCTTPLQVKCGDYSALVGPQNPQIYRRLILREDDLRISVRNIREDDLNE